MYSQTIANKSTYLYACVHSDGYLKFASSEQYFFFCSGSDFKFKSNISQLY